MDLPALVRAHGGLVTREQLLAAGVPRRQLSSSSSRLLRIRVGVYADRAVVDALPGPARAVLEVRAARLGRGVDLVAAGGTAAVVHDLPLLGRRPEGLQLVERKQDRPRHRGASTTLRSEEVVDVGVPVTSVPRTVMDVARSRGFAAGVVIADAALAKGVDLDALVDVLVGRQNWPGADAARQATAFARAGSESPLESLGRVRFAEQGLPPPDLQVVIADEDGPFARADQCWQEERTIAEADGALKYARPADLFAEKRREDRLRDLGWEVVRYTWDDALRRPELLAARVRRAFVRSARRSAV